MKREKAMKLREDWQGRSCDHPHFENEYFAGKETGNKVCSVCGCPIYTMVQTASSSLTNTRIS